MRSRICPPVQYSGSGAAGKVMQDRTIAPTLQPHACRCRRAAEREPVRAHATGRRLVLPEAAVSPFPRAQKSHAKPRSGSRGMERVTPECPMKAAAPCAASSRAAGKPGQAGRWAADSRPREGGANLPAAACRNRPAVRTVRLPADVLWPDSRIPAGAGTTRCRHSGTSSRRGWGTRSRGNGRGPSHAHLRKSRAPPRLCGRLASRRSAFGATGIATDRAEVSPLAAAAACRGR